MNLAIIPFLKKLENGNLVASSPKQTEFNFIGSITFYGMMEISSYFQYSLQSMDAISLLFGIMQNWEDT